MIALNEAGFNQLKIKSFEEANTLQTFVSGITNHLYVGENCTIWSEDESVTNAFMNLCEYKVLYNNELITCGEMLCRILDIYVAGMGLKNIVVDNTFRYSDNWIYEGCGVWIMTANYFFTTLLVAFKSREFPTEQLEKFAKEHEFSFEVQGEGDR